MMMRLLGLCVLTIALTVTPGWGQDNEACLMCHGDDELIGLNAAGQEISMFVADNALEGSVHEGFECIT